MSEDRDVQDWFNRSVEALPPQPFTLAVLQAVRRRERYWQLPRYAAFFVAACGGYLLLPQLVALLNGLAALPLVIVDAGGEHWPVLVVTAMGAGWWLVRQMRNTGLLPRA